MSDLREELWEWLCGRTALPCFIVKYIPEEPGERRSGYGHATLRDFVEKAGPGFRLSISGVGVAESPEQAEACVGGLRNRFRVWKERLEELDSF